MEPAQAFRNSSTRRSEFFRKVKPCCLEIVKALRKGHSSPRDAASAASSLVTLTDELYGILTEQVGYDASVLDAGMTDYAFFPLLPIFQHLEDYPARLAENATKCLRVLMQHGWKTSISKDAAQNFLILLTSVVTGGAGPGTGTGTGTGSDGRTAARAKLPEEVVIEGYRALAVLMRTAGAAASGPATPLTAENVVPALAHAVTVMLEGVTGSIIPAVQLEALEAIDALYGTIKDQEALASFLPGTVSALMRAVSAPGTQKTPKRVVVRTLQVLYTVVANTLGDLQTRHLHLQVKDKTPAPAKPAVPSPSPAKPAPAPSPAQHRTSTATRQVLNAAWLQATVSQVKLALTTVLKLRNHEAEDVRDAVHRFCIGLLDECHTSLSDCTSILVESAIVTATAADEEQTGDVQSGLGLGFQIQASAETGSRGFGSPQTTLQALAVLYPELGDAIKTTAYSWATSLPRAMQASDEGAKQRALRNLHMAISTLDAMHIDSAALEASLSAALRDSVVTLARASASAAPKAAVDEADDTDDVLHGGNLALLKPDDAQLVSSPLPSRPSQPFRPVLLALGSQRGTRDAMLSLLSNLGSTSQLTRLAGDMLDFVRDSDGLEQMAAFWLALELVKASYAKSAEMDALLDLGSFGGDGDGDGGGGSGSLSQEAVLEDLLALSASQLASHSDTYAGRDWRMGALALEATAFAASRMQESFRPELIDVLYPAATYLGSPEARLRSHAVAALNSLAASCGYASVSELIVDNVDYMLNSVSLRLNIMDISPASTKVLTMMIRLAGPRLVPFLDDVVAAIFAALDNYHGYPLFVESLFSVLGEVVQQSVKSDLLLLEDAAAAAPSRGGPTRNRKRREAFSAATEDLLVILDQRAKRRKTADEEEDLELDNRTAGHPSRPWTSEADKLLRKHEKEAAGDDEAGNEEENGGQSSGDGPTTTDLTKPEDPKTPTYALLARITTLTQHYLTSPTPTLRKSLLDLLTTVSPALAGDENAFLPLVHAIWPVVITRLYDGEPYVVIAACHALGALCGSAGDFVVTRVKAEWHANMRTWCMRAKTEAAGKIRASGLGSGSGSGSGLGSSKTKVASSLVQIHGRPKAYYGGDPSGTESTTDVLLPIRPAASSDDASLPLLTQVSPSTALATASASDSSVRVRVAATPTGLGRFTQAVQIWEAAAGLLTDIVSYVKLDDDIYDEILDLLLGTPAASRSGQRIQRVRLLPVSEEARAREALEVVNADAVWLAQYCAGQVGAATAPVLEGASFVSVGEA